MNAQNGNTGWVGRFKQALQQTEETRDPAHVASLFAAGAPLTNLGGDHGNDATTFWQTYIDQFVGVRSEFTSEFASESGAALEWKSRGTTAEGRPVEYRGVSVIEYNQDALTSFRTYYDSAAFVHTKVAAKA